LPPFAGQHVVNALLSKGVARVQGQLNHVRLVAPSAEFRWQSRWAEAAQEVFITGDFTGWAVRTRCSPVNLDVHRA